MSDKYIGIHKAHIFLGMYYGMVFDATEHGREVNSQVENYSENTLYTHHSKVI